ncbi:hypothetical protein TVAG_278340 [Trichomonas vaginalis G3]|uniref:Surface antigen BspA-like n=1 Tax=Trichomonas vaginalis (strain ATCC PRA-98 / G3) TaxID=412133 RepID=A2DU75_TRIV3|nr:ribonuclease inhibitor domain-containing protein [Trichomonas vaginalis G3]EAY16068.1 hypothetical protein TVAG_278340 [Trichomonas vaginalis G3]KAI5537266.1 ribonuclease inhibitor domain-containing protein [Trichomonas vaginalis G3]|eukprot:XP_001328291.1 hypothetical protein [Trichomonas vaginalis G3]
MDTIIIPSNSKISSLGYNMLANTLIRMFNIPALVNTIEKGCFEYAFLDSITVSSGNNNFKIENNMILTIDGSISLGYPLRMTGTAVFPNGVNRIEYALFGSTSISHVQFPDSLKEIGAYAFYKSKIQDVFIPNSVTSIGYNAFASCPNLASVRLSESLTILDAYTFQEALITSINFPDSIKRIETSCFVRCWKLSEVTLPDNITYLAGNAFPKTTKLKFGPNSNLYIDSQLLIIDKSNQTINGYIGENVEKEFVILNSIQTITSSVFDGRDKISKITFPGDSMLKSIKNAAFSNCISSICGSTFHYSDN